MTDIDIESLTQEELDEWIAKLRDTLARYRKARGEPDPDDSPEVPGIPSESQ